MICRRSVLAGLASASFSAPAIARAAFRPLFNGRDLDGWTPVGDANWTVTDGVLAADKGAMSFLVSRDSFRNFDLRVEIWVSDDANSGIFIRCADRLKITPATSYEINVFDRRPDPTYGTGAIVDIAPVSPMPKAGSRWNLIEIRARGDALTIVFNGQKTVDAVRDAAHAEGPIALQYASGVVKFRMVEVRAA